MLYFFKKRVNKKISNFKSREILNLVPNYVHRWRMIPNNPTSTSLQECSKLNASVQYVGIVENTCACTAHASDQIYIITEGKCHA